MFKEDEHPTTTRTNPQVAKVENLLDSDIALISEETCLSIGTVYIIKEN